MRKILHNKHCLLFLYLTDQYTIMPQSMQSAFLSMATYLAANLEYGPDNIHNNHVLNNARALYFAGESLSIPQLSTIGKSIIKIEVPNFISSDGFVKEGSSHYHFLITRWFLEMYWLASVVGDKEYKNELETILKKMLPACCFFLILRNRRKGRGTRTRGILSLVSISCRQSFRYGHSLDPKNLSPDLLREAERFRFLPRTLIPSRAHRRF